MFLVELIASSFFYLISKQARRECRCKRVLVLFIVQFLYSFFLEVLFGGALDHLNCQTTGEFDQNFSKKSKRGEFTICISPIICLVCPPKFCISIVFYFSSLGTTVIPKDKTKVMQRFGGQTRCIMGDVQIANGQFWNWLVHKGGFTVFKLLVCSWHHNS